MGDLDGRVALVTGASRGIGRAVARRLAQEGARVVCCARSQEALQETVELIRQGGGEAHAQLLDVTRTDQAREVVGWAHGELGSLDILVNNAGIVEDQLFVRMKPEQWRRVLDVDLDGVFNVTQPAAKVMMRQRWGRIVNVTSVVALMGNPGQANYAAAKAGLIGMTRALAKELGSRNITVNAVAPGYIETEMTATLTEEQRRRLLETLAIPRLGTAGDVAAAVAFLAGPGGDYITGTVLNVSGGLYI